MCRPNICPPDQIAFAKVSFFVRYLIEALWGTFFFGALSDRAWTGLYQPGHFWKLVRPLGRPSGENCPPCKGNCPPLRGKRPAYRGNRLTRKGNLPLRKGNGQPAGETARPATESARLAGNKGNLRRGNPPCRETVSPETLCRTRKFSARPGNFLQ